MNRGVFLPRVVVWVLREVGASVWDRVLNLRRASRWILEGSEPFARGGEARFERRSLGVNPRPS